MKTKSWWPTNKWWAASVTTAGTVVLMFWTAGGVDTDDKKVVLVGLIVQRVVAYVARNEPDQLVVQDTQIVAPVAAKPPVRTK